MPKRDTILLVDDVEMNRAILSGLFQEEYHILEAENGEQALLLLNQYHSSIAVMLLDVVMPVKDGHQVLEEIRTNGLLDEVPVVVITADGSLESELKAFDLGASDIIVKPFEPHVVTRRVRNIVELSQHRHNLESLVEEQAHKLHESNKILVDALSSVIEYRSLESGLHIRRIRLLTKVLLEEVARNCPEYGLDDVKIDQIADASAMHDIGKIAIPDSILNKPGRLTPEEFEVMKTHTLKGCEILESLDRMSDQDYLRYAYNICRYHHERWDGRGYPDGLCGDAIPICAQATGIADAYDALTSDRVYKKAIAHEQAANMILNGECGSFSPRLLECFKNVLVPFASLVKKYADGGVPQRQSGGSQLLISPKLQNSSALQIEQMKFQALLRYNNSTVIEVDFSTGSYQLVYSTFPGLRMIFQGQNLEEIVEQQIERMIFPEDVGLVRRIWYEELPHFFEEGLLKQSWGYRACDRSGDGWQRYEVTVLRVDTENPHQRRALLLWNACDPGDGTHRRTGPALGDPKILHNIMDGVVCFCNDRHFTIRSVEDGFLGYSRSELATLFQNRYLLLIHPDDRARVRQQLLQQLSEGPGYELEYRVLQPGGRTTWMLSRGQLVIDPEGAESLYSILIDIEHSKEAQEQLRLSLERYRIILEQTNDIIFEWDIATDHVVYSAKWKESFGYEPIQDNASQRIPTVSHLHPDDMAAFGALIERMRTGARYNELDFRVSNAKGRYQWCRIRATAQFDDNGLPCRAIGIIININEEKVAAQELQAQSERDSLTGLYNKSSSRRRIEECLARREEDEGAALLIIDIDNFKQINDRHGHMFGDAVLSKISTRIAHLFRGEDIVARIGGDEFMVMIQGLATGERVSAVAARVVDCFGQTMIDLPTDCHISCSVGIAQCPQDGVDFQSLFRRADTALYQAKAKGKNRYLLYEPAMEGAALDAALTCAPKPRTAIDSDRAGFTGLNELIPGVFRMLKEAQDLGKAVSTVLEMVGKRMQVSRAYVFETGPDGSCCSNTFEWCNEGIPSQKEKLQRFDFADFDTSYQSLFNEQDVFYCDNPSKLPPDVFQLMQMQGVRSILQCAIRFQGKFYGWVGFDDCVDGALWTREQIDLLSFIAEILSLFLCRDHLYPVKGEKG